MRLQLMSPAASRRAPHQATRAAGRAEVAPRRWHGTLKKTAPAAAGSEATHHTGAATEFEFADPSSEEKTTILFGVKDGTGALNGVLGLFVEHGIDMTHIQSRPARRDMEAFEFEVDFVGSQFQSDVQKFLAKLKASVGELTVLDQQQVPWFPRSATDFDMVKQDTLDAGSELDSDHPGFTDQAYRERRRMICDIAIQYRRGAGATPLEIPRVEYTPDEIATWGKVFSRCQKLYPAYACKQYNSIFRQLTQEVGYAPDNIPQLQDVNAFLQKSSGFSLRPVGGLLSARAFLGGLAFRIFFSTQYIRHHSKPFYTPEPDVCHELLGHAPMFADQDFADFSQEIGLASLGASDADIERLASTYWFSVEFGLCWEKDAYGSKLLKAYGAGCLSSYGELEHAMGVGPDGDVAREIRPWEPMAAAHQEYPITKFQPVYYAADSFADAREKMAEFSRGVKRPFHVRYNPTTQHVEYDRNIFVSPPPGGSV